MAISYSTIRQECFLRSAQLAGTDQDSLATAYTAETVDGGEVPKVSFRTQIINIEMEFCHIIGSDASHPYRTYLYGRSSNLANLSATPQNDQNGVPFFGVFDSCADSATNRTLTLQPSEILDDLSESFFDDTDLWNYSIVGNYIQHTRPLAYLQGCSFDQAAAYAAYDADGTSPLPEMLINTWIAGVIANLPQTGWTDGAAVAQMYVNTYQQGIQLLRLGATQMVPLASINAVAG